MLLNIKTQYLKNPDNEIEIDDIKVIHIKYNFFIIIDKRSKSISCPK